MGSFVFHVVSSVKGGCGKSTFAFYLADYLSKNGGSVYLIDLDTSGTSWLEDYDEYYDSETASVFLNDIIDDSKIHRKIEPWRHITRNPNRDRKWHDSFAGNPESVRLCIADPERRKYTPEYQIDLFEQAVASLIQNEILNQISNNDIHIVLDMPPGVEAKAEKIFRYWLPKKASESYLKGNQTRIRIKLYMLTNLSNASVSANWKYIRDLLAPRSYNDWFARLMKEENALSISMILNDIGGIFFEGQSEIADKRIISGDMILEQEGNLLTGKDEIVKQIMKKGCWCLAYIPRIECVHSRYTHLKSITSPGNTITTTNNVRPCFCKSKKGNLSGEGGSMSELFDILCYD